MIEIKIFDSLGTELNLGDLVSIQCSRNRGYLTFYTRVQVVKGQLYPFNKFSFDRITKISEIPNGCNYAPTNIENSFPEYWMHPKQELLFVNEKELHDWRMDALMFDANKFYKVSEILLPTSTTK